jgi:O-antigen ligase
MLQTNSIFSMLLKNKYIIPLIMIIAAIIVGVMGTLNPLLAVGCSALLILFILFLRWPDVTVIFVVFVIYTNAAVVLIKFHHVPQVLGYALPAMLLVPFTWYLVVQNRKIRTNLVFVLMMIYLAIIMISSVFSRDINLALPDIITYLAEGLGLYFLLFNTIRTPKLLKQVVWSLLIAGALMGGLSLLQQLTGTFNNDYGGFAQVDGKGFTTEETIQGKVVQLRVAGPVGEKNRYGQVMLMLVPLGFFQALGEESRKFRLLAFILTGLTLVGCVLTFSRGAMVAFLLLILIMGFLKYIKLGQLFGVLLGILLLLQAFPQINQRFSTLGNIFSSQDAGGLENADGSIQGRATEMLVALLVFRDHPIIGVGSGMYRYEVAKYSEIIGYKNIAGEREPHSLYPGVAAETGIMGFTTLMAIFLYTLYRLATVRAYWLERKKQDVANLCTGFFLAVVSYMATGIFLHISYFRYLWIIMALAAVASEFKESDLTNDAGQKTAQEDLLLPVNAA